MSAFARQARELCPESDEYHDQVQPCPHCKLLEQRLTPITEALADVLKDADLTVEFRWEDIL